MEKLQSALQKARRDRQKVALTPARPIVQEGSTARDLSPSDAGWESIPRVNLDPDALLQNRILTSGADGQKSAGFDLLRTKIQLQMEKNDWTRLAITSPMKSAGKTTVCANIAFALSRQDSKRAIIYEFDMRRPAIARIFGLKPERSTAELLRGDVEFKDQAFRIGSNVAVSCNPKPLSTPSDLFLDPRTLEQLTRLEKTYKPDIVLFDLPPLQAGDDATAFFPNVDCVLLIAEAENCTIKQIDTAERDIAEHTNFLGVVLNKCRYPEEGEGYGYGYY